MSFQLAGNSGVVQEVEANTRAARVVLRPDDYGALGIYATAGVTGTMAAGIGGASEIFQFRWADASRLALIRYIGISAGGTSTAFAAGICTFDAIVARGWTGQGTGGTALTLTGNNMKMRASMAASLVAAGDLRVATTAALGVGTKTLDAQAIGSVTQSVPAVAGSVLCPPWALFNPETGSEHPIVLAQNEGFCVRCAVPATGTWTAAITVRWIEITSY